MDHLRKVREGWSIWSCGSAGEKQVLRAAQDDIF